MLTAYSRVTVVTDERRVDLALPSALPLSDVVAQVFRYCGGPEDATPGSLALARVGGPPLGLGQTLEEAGVLDGDVLELRPRAAELEPAQVEDVRDAVEDATEAAGGAWTPATTVTFTVVSLVVALGVLGIWCSGLLDAVAPSAAVPAPPSDGIVAGTGLAVAVAGIALTWWVGQAGAARWAVRPVLVVALAWAWIGGTALGALAGWPGPVTSMVAFALVAATAGGARLVSPRASAFLSFAVVLLVVAVTFGVTDEMGVESLQTLRVVAVLVLLAVGIAPRVSLSVGGLASADYRVRNAATMPREAVAARYRESNALLVGALSAIASVAGAAGVVLTFRDGSWDRWLALAVGLLLLSRSRVFSRVAHMIALRVAGVVVLAAQLVREVAELDATAWLVVVVLAVGLLLVGIASLPMSEISRARAKRVLNIVELLLVIQAVVLAFGAVGGFERMGQMIS